MPARRPTLLHAVACALPPRLLTALVTLIGGAVPSGPAVAAAAAPTPASAPRVYRDRIEPHWYADNTRFWYRNHLPGDCREFVIVDADRGTRAPAFHHSRVAEAIATATGQAVDAGKLPVDAIEFAPDGASVVLTGSAGVWRWFPASGELRPESTDSREDGIPAETEPRPSLRTGPETSVRFENRLRDAIDLCWMSPEGQRIPYGRIDAGATRDQHTFAGHVWIAVRSGEVVAVFEAVREPGRAVISDTPPSRRRGPRRGGARAETRTALPSPDGRLEAFVRDHNLWLREPSTREEWPLSFDGNPGNSFRKDVQRARLVGMEYDAPEPPASLPEVFWSPDSRRLVALQTRTVPERRVQLIESSPVDQVQPKLSSYTYLKPGDDLPTQTPRCFEATTRREIRVATDRFAHPWSLDEFRWAPNSTRFTFLYNQRGHQVLRVLAVTWPEDSTSLEASVATLVDETSPTFIDYSNKTHLEWLDATGELIWMSERSGWNHLYLIDAQSGALRNPITQGDWVVRQVVRVDPDTRRIWFMTSGLRAGEDPYHLHLARVNLDGTGFVLLTEGDGTHDIQWSPDRRFFIDTWSRVDAPPTLELRRAEDGVRVCDLERADAREVLAARGRFPERFTAWGRDGLTDIWGMIHRPRDFRPDRRYPVIENIYAGPHGQHVPKAFRAAYRSQEELADRGFIVVQIDGMGTNWRSKRFHDVASRNVGDAGFPDRIAWLRAAEARFPELDLSRLGIYGGSAGGQNAMRALIAHGDLYDAAFADCGCHDNRMDKIWWNEAWMGWPVGPHYADQSNVTQAHRLQGHLMLCVGELDRNVDPASTLQVVSALIKADKDFEFLLIPGAGHGAAESDYGRRRRAEFFVRHLQPQASSR